MSGLREHSDPLRRQAPFFAAAFAEEEMMRRNSKEKP